MKSVVTDAEKDEEMIPHLLDFKAFADKLISQAFVDEVPPLAGARPTPPQASSSKAPLPTPPIPIMYPNQGFRSALRDGVSAGFKARRNEPAEMIAQHLDKAMRREQKGQCDEDLEVELHEVLALYPFTDGKDVFRASGATGM